MLKLTLDTNCIIDVDERRDGFEVVMALAAAHVEGRVDVALVCSGAHERQKGGGYLESFSLFTSRVHSLGFPDLPVLPSIMHWDISFWGHGILADEAMKAREELIFKVMFPNVSFEWPRYAEAKGVPSTDTSSAHFQRWRNRLCDVQAFWSHDHVKRDIFVTRDIEFGRLGRHPDFADAHILTPTQVASLLG